MAKIKVNNPVVELDGDEMTRIIWKQIREQLILPYLDVDLEYYDLGIEHRDATDDQVTIDAANAIKRHGVGVKCATITPDEARVEEFGLKKMWRSPNGTIRNILGGVVFREPIIMSNVPRLVPGWTKPIVIGRHAHGDQYKATDFVVPGPGKVTITYTPGRRRRADGVRGRRLPRRRRRDGHVQLRRLDPRLRPRVAALRPRPQLPGLPVDQEHDPQGVRRPVQGPLRRGLRDRVRGRVQGRRPHLRAPADRRHGRRRAEVGGRLRLGLQELRRRRAVRHRGAGLRLARPDDLGADDAGRPAPCEAEAAHGTVTRHYRQWQKGEKTSTNPIASIFAWTRGLAHRGKLDGTPEVTAFAETLEQVCVETVEGGQMTKDLALLIAPDAPWLTTDEFMNALNDNLARKVGA